MARNPPLRGIAGACRAGELLDKNVLPRGQAQGSHSLPLAPGALDILAEKQLIAPAMAVPIGKLSGSTPDLWVNNAPKSRRGRKGLAPRIKKNSDAGTSRFGLLETISAGLHDGAN
jgi:hypothetical protein